MRTIVEQTMLFRGEIELPAGLKPSTEEFREGWSFVNSKDSRLLEKKILRQGWKFIKIVDGWLRSGVGETPQKAIASALNLALREVTPHFNAVEVNHVEWTQYPWFFLARVMVNPYRIQEGALLPVPDKHLPPATALRSRRLPPEAAALFPHFASAMPLVKEMLVLSRSSQTRMQG
jgi:hypothetical protein